MYSSAAVSNNFLESRQVLIHYPSSSPRLIQNLLCKRTVWLIISLHKELAAICYCPAEKGDLPIGWLWWLPRLDDPPSLSFRAFSRRGSGCPRRKGWWILLSPRDVSSSFCRQRMIDRWCAPLVQSEWSGRIRGWTACYPMLNYVDCVREVWRLIYLKRTL